MDQDTIDFFDALFQDVSYSVRSLKSLGYLSSLPNSLVGTCQKNAIAFAGSLEELLNEMENE